MTRIFGELSDCIIHQKQPQDYFDFRSLLFDSVLLTNSAQIQTRRYEIHVQIVSS